MCSTKSDRSVHVCSLFKYIKLFSIHGKLGACACDIDACNNGSFTVASKIHSYKDTHQWQF